MVRETSQMFITGPDVVQAVTGEEITQNGLGGADVHAETSGVAHFAYDDEETCLEEVRYLLSLLPQNNRENPPARGSPTTRPTGAATSLLDLVPADGNRPYDMRKVIEEIVDDGDYLEVHERWARNIICALARLDGQVVGIVANQPQSLAGVLDIEAVGEGRPLRPDVRRLQHPARHPAGRARLPARRRPGARRDHPARRQAAVRVLQRHRAADLADPAQGVRRRVHRHGLASPSAPT